MTSLPTRSPAINACGLAPAHGLIGAAGEDGGLECFDVRQRDSLGWLDAAGAAGMLCMCVAWHSAQDRGDRDCD